MMELDENTQRMLDQIMDFSVSIEKLYQQEVILETNQLLDTEEHQNNQRYLSTCIETEDEKYRELFSRNIDKSLVMDYIYIRSMELDVSDDVITRIQNKINYLSFKNKVQAVYQKKELFPLDDGLKKEQLAIFNQLLYECYDLHLKCFALQKIDSTIQKTTSSSFREKLIEKKYALFFQDAQILKNNQKKKTSKFFDSFPPILRNLFLDDYLQEQASDYLASLSIIKKAEYDENRVDVYYQIYSFAGLISLMTKDQVQGINNLIEMDSKKYKMLPPISRALQLVLKESLFPIEQENNQTRKRK